MIINIKPGKVEVKHFVCDYHKRNPNKKYAGCTCSSIYTLKRINHDPHR
jgi:hypothetical protein